MQSCGSRGFEKWAGAAWGWGGGIDFHGLQDQLCPQPLIHAHKAPSTWISPEVLLSCSAPRPGPV